MIINIENTDDVKKIPRSAITHIMDEIILDGMVSKQDIVSLEAHSAICKIPDSIKNSISTVRSKHGADKLISYINNIMYDEHSITTREVYDLISRRLSNILSIDFSVLVSKLEADYATLDKLYVPNNIREIANITNNNVTSLPVMYLFRNTLAGEMYSEVTSVTLGYLGNIEKHVSFGLLSLMNNMCNCIYDGFSAESLTIAYSGTVGEFIKDNINELNTASRPDLLLLEARLKEHAAYDDHFIYNTTDSHIRNKIFNVVKNDRFISDK